MSESTTTAAASVPPITPTRKRKSTTTAAATTPVSSESRTSSAPATPKATIPPITRFFTPERVSRSSSAAAAAASASPKSATPPTKKHVDVEYEVDEDDVMMEESKEDISTSTSSTPTSTSRKKSLIRGRQTAPDHWKEVYVGIETMRLRGIAKDAPVDTLGCERLADRASEPKVFRFQTLVSLMLSAQTKDAVTAQAMTNLKAHWKDGLTIQNVLATDESVIDQLISKVGFHVRKAGYIKKTAAVCAAQYNGDIPATLDELVALPGVGPKMAHLTLQVAWQNVIGVGVDTHVHRISNRLGWVKSNTPEQTRTQLQDWLPKEYWGPINMLLVGFGQKVCLPVGPKCSVCQVNSLCPEGRRNLRYDKSPTKFHPIPTLPPIQQLIEEDEATAQKVLSETQLSQPTVKLEPPPVAAPSTSPPVVTSRFFPLTVVKSEPIDAAATTASTANPPSRSNEIRVKMEEDTTMLDTRTIPQVKVEDEPFSTPSSSTSTSSTLPPAKKLKL